MLQAEDISKSYGGVLALAGADLTVRAGTVHALLGENGAGKSTLVKIIAGVVTPDSGVLRLDGERVSFASSADAARSGVSVVSQELNLFEDLDVLANLYPMREPRRGPFISRSTMDRRARPVLAELGLDVSPRTPVRELTLAQRQLVEIAKALLTEPRVLVLDEPTSALDASSAETLFGILRVLRERQVAVVFVSHILEEAMALCDEVTVLRDGRPVIAGQARAELDIGTVVRAMLGEQRARRFGAAVEGRTGARNEAADEAGQGNEPSDAELASAVAFETTAQGNLELAHVEVAGRLHDVSFTAEPGAVLGLAGIPGSGRLAVLELIVGMRRSHGGEILLPSGKPVSRGMRRAFKAGVALVPGDRRRLGLMLDKSIWENVAQVRAVGLAAEGPIVRAGRLRARARVHVKRLAIRTRSVDERAGQLSGGNQQKVVFAKWLEAAPSVLLLDDPTRGVDVGAKAEMHTLIAAAAKAGAVVVLCSTDLDELASVSDRVVVLWQGKVCADLSGRQLSRQSIGEAMHTGALDAAATPA
jgi:ABC-type sugar transport system ATPase subunit